ncbi:2-phosphosulfolactate phosphatase [Clostridium sp. DL1XJH146]
MFVDVMNSGTKIEKSKLSDKSVVIIDVLRATSTIITALVNKAKCVIPVSTVEEGWEIHHKLEENSVILGGERKAVQIQGFTLGNSPLNYKEEKVKGKTVVITTTNGTIAIKESVGADNIYIGALLNAFSVAEKIFKDEKDIVIICSGTNGDFSLDDAYCAGMIIDYIGKMAKIELSDLAWTLRYIYKNNKNNPHTFLKNCRHYKILEDKGFHDDLKYCLQSNIYSVVPTYVDGKIVLLE